MQCVRSFVNGALALRLREVDSSARHDLANKIVQEWDTFANAHEISVDVWIGVYFRAVFNVDPMFATVKQWVRDLGYAIFQEFQDQLKAR